MDPVSFHAIVFESLCAGKLLFCMTTLAITLLFILFKGAAGRLCETITGARWMELATWRT